MTEHPERPTLSTHSVDELLAADARIEYPVPNRVAIKELEATHVLQSYQKIDVLLAAAGDKPAAFVTIESPTWGTGDGPKEIPDSDDETFRTVAEDLGLTVRSVDRTLEPSDTQAGVVIRNMTVSRSRELAEAAHGIINDSIGVTRPDGASGFVYDEIALGALLGFPASAVKAFAEQRSHTETAHVRDLEIQTFARFAVSDENEAEELQTGKRWAASVKRLSPVLYNKEMDDMAGYLKGNGMKYDDPRRRMGRLYARFLRSRDI